MCPGEKELVSHASRVSGSKVSISTIPTPKSLDDLVQLLHHELGSYGLDSEKIDVQRIQSIMEAYDSNEKDWESFAMFDECKYTRNLIDDGNGKFNLMLLCWGESQSSPIHDHSNAHCLMKVLSGSLAETRYAWPEAQSKMDDSCLPKGASPCLKLLKVSHANRNEVVYINDDMALHRVGNLQKDRKAVSLHLYTPPFETCQTFCEATGHARKSGRCTFYSKNGVKVQYGYDLSRSTDCVDSSFSIIDSAPLVQPNCKESSSLPS